MKLRLTEVPFIGHVLTAEGVKIDPKKVEAVINMPEPQNVREFNALHWYGVISFEIFASTLRHNGTIEKAYRQRCEVAVINLTSEDY